jgi:deoxyribonuclease V
MILAVDVQYTDDIGVVSGVEFNDWKDAKPLASYESIVRDVEEYQPGQFYRREMPCVLQLLKENCLKPDILVIDGFVTLGLNDSAGLGMHLYKALGENVKVIGVAKKSFSGTRENTKVFRGNSNKPLYVTSVGLDVEDAKQYISMMHGKHRLPVLLKLVDKLCRDKANRVAGGF